MHTNIRVTFTVVLASALWVACQEKKQATDAPSSMSREMERPATTVSEPYHSDSPSIGNFESLVADFESQNRAIWQKPDLVISLLGDLEGKTVADIGAGTGYFTFRLLPKASHVIGIDIDQRFISFMDSVKVRLPETYRKRFESRLAKPEDPLLKPGEADAVMIVNTYGYMENRVNYLKTLSKGMTTKGKLLIIDFKKNNLPVGPPMEFKVSTNQVKKELLEAGYTHIVIDNNSLDYQYIILAEK